MLIVVSPAKKLDYETTPPAIPFTQPAMLDDAKRLITRCRSLTPQDLSALMKISDTLAGLNVARFAQWTPEFTLSNAKQAVFAFRGDVYTGLDADSLSEASLDYAQRHLRILSGLYGVLRPLDLMQAYRLEMGTKLDNEAGKDLYAFWGERITGVLNQALAEQGDDLLINLASNEYFKSVKKAKLQGRIVTPVFKDCKNGQYKVISFYAKKARGLMARYLIQQEIKDIEQLTRFDWDGYYYSEQDSTPEQPVFLREEQK